MNIGRLALYRIIRDPRRSLLQASGIAVVCILLILWSTLCAGFSSTIYKMATRLVLGQVQIHHPNFLQSESIYDHFPLSEKQGSDLTSRGVAYSYRLYQYALASFGDATKGVRVVGLDPSREEATTDLSKHVGQGHFLRNVSEKEALLGSHLAEVLKIKVGDEIVILGTAADGSVASDLYHVVGILNPVGQLIDDRYLYINDKDFRSLFGFEQGVHEIIIGPSERTAVFEDLDVSPIKALFPNDEVKTWRQIRPQLGQVLDLLRFAGYVSLTLVFMALGMLILNLKLMTVFDRSREYGVMLAVGLHPRQLCKLVLFESMWLGVFAGILAIFIGGPLAYWTEIHGLDFSFLIDHFTYTYLVFDPVLFGYLGWEQILTPLLFMMITLPIASLYPALLAARFQPKDAIVGKGAGL